jgi:hypothetical protein
LVLTLGHEQERAPRRGSTEGRAREDDGGLDPLPPPQLAQIVRGQGHEDEPVATGLDLTPKGIEEQIDAPAVDGNAGHGTLPGQRLAACEHATAPGIHDQELHGAAIAAAEHQHPVAAHEPRPIRPVEAQQPLGRAQPAQVAAARIGRTGHVRRLLLDIVHRAIVARRSTHDAAGHRRGMLALSIDLDKQREQGRKVELERHPAPVG